MAKKRQSIKQLEAEVRRMERVSALKQKRKMLEKKVKAMKFRKTTFGKVGGAITSVAEKLTRPQKRDAKGKVIAGTGGLGAKVVQKIKSLGTPAPGQPRHPQQQVRRVSSSPMETAFATPVHTEQKMANLDRQIGQFAGMGPARTSVARAVKKKLKKTKPFNVNDFMKTLPA